MDRSIYLLFLTLIHTAPKVRKYKKPNIKPSKKNRTKAVYGALGATVVVIGTVAVYWSCKTGSPTLPSTLPARPSTAQNLGQQDPRESPRSGATQNQEAQRTTSETPPQTISPDSSKNLEQRVQDRPESPRSGATQNLPKRPSNVQNLNQEQQNPSESPRSGTMQRTTSETPPQTISPELLRKIEENVKKVNNSKIGKARKQNQNLCVKRFTGGYERFGERCDKKS